MSFQALRPPFRTDVRLSGCTSLGVGGKADLFFAPHSVHELREELRWLRAEGIPFAVLGGGTNVACRDDGVRGAIITTQALNRACHEGSRIRARAGCLLAPLVRKCCDLGLSGMEPLAGIPGSVGGAVVMNAGGRYGCIGPLVEEVRTLTVEGEERVYHQPKERFSYRRGDFNGEIVTEVALGLVPSDPGLVRRKLRRILREKFATQPLAARSAGCVFKNPSGDAVSRVSEEAVPAAGWLIDACGLKDLAVGGMRVSQVHANFIVNMNGGRFGEFMELAGMVSDRVSERFGVEMEFEVTVF